MRQVARCSGVAWSNRGYQASNSSFWWSDVKPSNTLNSLAGKLRLYGKATGCNQNFITQ